MGEDSSTSSDSPLRAAKGYDEPSVFEPESLLAEARRQKEMPAEPVPEVCVLDPDGDIVGHLRDSGEARLHPAWPGYHTDLYRFERGGETLGIVGHAVGAPFAVLVAEQLFAAGCELLVSVTSSGQIRSRGEPPYFVLVERALRDEGTSHHYREPGDYATLDDALRDAVERECESVSRPVYTGATWTTDAPFRETERAIDRARSAGILAVEMEAAALYTFGAVRNRPVVCFAHVTNRMGRDEAEFEKGEADGSRDALAAVDAAVRGWRSLS
jgi:uridine phosphorylase